MVGYDKAGISKKGKLIKIVYRNTTINDFSRPNNSEIKEFKISVGFKVQYSQLRCLQYFF